MRCFWALCGDRQGLGRIPWGSVHAWCRARFLVGEDEDDVHELVGRLDVAYIEWAQRKVKFERSIAESKNSGNAG